MNRCRWSTIIGDPTIFIESDNNKLNILDTEKGELLLKDPLELNSSKACTYSLVGNIPETGIIFLLDIRSIDCHPEGNLLAVAGWGRTIRVYDHRAGKIVKDLSEHASNGN